MPPRRGTPHLLAVARGDEPADLLLTGGSIFVPGTREWVREDLAIADGKGENREARRMNTMGNAHNLALRILHGRVRLRDPAS